MTLTICGRSVHRDDLQSEHARGVPRQRSAPSRRHQRARHRARIPQHPRRGNGRDLQRPCTQRSRPSDHHPPRTRGCRSGRTSHGTQQQARRHCRPDRRGHELRTPDPFLNELATTTQQPRSRTEHRRSRCADALHQPRLTTVISCPATARRGYTTTPCTTSPEPRTAVHDPGRLAHHKPPSPPSRMNMPRRRASAPDPAKRTSTVP